MSSFLPVSGLSIDSFNFAETLDELYQPIKKKWADQKIKQELIFPKTSFHINSSPNPGFSNELITQLTNSNWGLNPSMIVKADEGPIPEDSRLRKFLACLPIVGIAITILNERSLQKRIRRSRDLTRIVKMIQVKNHYKIASIIRSILTAAVVVAVAFAVFKASVFILIAGGAACVVGGGVAIAYACFRHKNVKLTRSFKGKQLVEELLFHLNVKDQGLPKSTKVW